MNQYELVAGLEEFSKVINEYLFQFQEILNSDVMKGVELTDSKDSISALNKIMKNIDAQIKTADRKFTLAIFGEFKAGKSTLINALLGLSNEARLSTEDSPDTACSVLLRHKSESDAEAKILMNDGSSHVVSWEEAKGISSQIYRDKNPNRFQYDKIVEIEYYVDSDLLRTISLNDLPGTGSRYYDTHTEAARTKMREADAVIWVTPGDKEPDAATREELYKLEDYGQRVIPIVNIIEDLDRGLSRDQNAVDAISRVLDEDWSEFFAIDIEKPVYVSAKMLNTELSKEEPNTELLAQYGYYDLLTVIDNIKLTAQGKGNEARIKRLKGVGLNLFSEARGIISNIIHDANTQYTIYKSKEIDYGNQKEEIDFIKSVLRADTRNHAKSKAHDICEIIINQGIIFVDQTLTMENVKDLIEAAKDQDRFKVELQKRFEENYLKLHEQPNWLDELMKNYAEDIKDIVMPKWKNFVRKALHEDVVVGKTPKIEIEWDNLSDSLVQAIMKVIQNLLIIGLVAVILAAIPGAQVVDAIVIGLTIIASLIKDPLKRHRDAAKQKIEWEMKARQYGIENSLFDAAQAGIDKIQKQVENIIAGGESQTRNIIDYISRLLERSKDPIEIIDGINEIWNN